MDLEVLKKKISTFRGEGGRVTKVSDELLIEILLAWEQWSGPMKGFYAGIGVSKEKMASMLGKAKRLKREGFPTDGFKEIKVSGITAEAGQLLPCRGIEVAWENGKLIRFSQVEQLIDFLKKVA
jgi:hypothetical protein